MSTNSDNADELIAQAAEATVETASIDFKASLDVEIKGNGSKC